MKPRLHPARTWIAITVLLAINGYVCRELFGAEFIHQMGSVEGSFIAISRWALEHTGGLTWFPLWFTGIPFLGIYQPGFHLIVAGLAALLHITPQHAYHLVNALVYCFQPVTFFALCYAVTGTRGYAFIAALVYSLLSPSAFLSTLIRNDLGGLWFARRYQTLVHYGEGPHNAALLLIPLAILFLDRAVTGRRRRYLPPACLVLAAVVLLNWPGTIGLGMAVAAYWLSRLGGKPPLAWGWLAAVGAIAYLIACRWVPPSVLLAVPRNAQLSDGTPLGSTQLMYLGDAILVLAGVHVLLERFRVDRWLRFFLFFTFISGGVSLANYWFGMCALPQPHRFHVEMEMGIVGAGVYLVRLVWLRCPWWIQAFALVALALGAAVQIRTYRTYAHGQTLPEDITATLEYRMAEWFQANMPGARVFAPGSVSIWMNAFVDVPQVAGCCDQGVPTLQHRLAYFTIYTGMNTGDRYVPTALLWLKAFGARAFGVGGRNGKEFFKAFVRPEAFRGVLPELWRDGEDAIYSVPGGSPSLAHVLQPSEIVNRRPVNGLDTEPLVPYVAALDRDGSGRASLRWLSPDQVRVEAAMEGGEVLSVQITYNPGWHALANGAGKPLRADGLGLMVIEPSCNGPCTVDLIWDGGREARWTEWAQGIGLALCFLWPAWPWLTRRFR